MIFPVWLWVLAGAMVLGGLLHGRSRRFQRDMHRVPMGCTLILVGMALIVAWFVLSTQFAHVLGQF